MATHDLNFTDILVDWGTKYAPFAGLSANPQYIHKLLTSRHVLNYIFLFVTATASKLFFTVFNEKNTPTIAIIKRKVSAYITKVRG